MRPYPPTERGVRVRVYPDEDQEQTLVAKCRARMRSRTPPRLPRSRASRRFLEGLIAIYELGVKFERHGRDPRRMTPAMLLEHFAVSYAEGHGRAHDRFDELVGLLRSPRPGKGY